jgi:IS5 family transposase
LFSFSLLGYNLGGLKSPLSFAKAREFASLRHAVQAKMLAERFRAVLSVAIMSIGPFRSTLEPFREFIISKRRARLTWEEIALAIREQGVACTRQAVQGYYKRQKNMRVPMGFESARPTLESTNRPNLKQAAAEPRQIKKEKGHEWPTREEANQIIQ